ncbi:hypothetical protein [Nitrosomonas sp. HPC101]|uniref:hypothetical protein n=1 Tax=Nitrosomonas sp. HPC101 TaxID=1658667 RepID=UPI001878633E|nr:hypothetical protein [Nitrosomonas sp. HPC101]
MLFKSHLRSILNIAPQSGNETEPNAVPIHSGKTIFGNESPYTNTPSRQGKYDASFDDTHASRLEAENTAIHEARGRIETEARAHVTAEARARVEANARLADTEKGMREISIEFIASDDAINSMDPDTPDTPSQSGIPNNPTESDTIKLPSETHGNTQNSACNLAEPG